MSAADSGRVSVAVAAARKSAHEALRRRRSATFTDRRKEASKRACRGKARYDS